MLKRKFLPFVGLLLGLARAATGQVVTEFPVPTADSFPAGITAGPDGNLWFTEYDSDKIGRITPAGAVVEFPIPTPDSRPGGITVGPDGNLWFAEGDFDSNQIGRITTAGVITEFPLLAFSMPSDITAGPDGNLWYTATGNGNIGRITTAGVVTEFDVPSAGATLDSITAGPDGNLWFTERTGSRIGRITTDGVITEFDTPTPNSLPSGIVAGPDGNVWFAEGVGQIGRITPAGVITEFPVPHGEASGITAGPDGNLWFTAKGRIGRITTAGVVTEFSLPSPLTFAGDITAGPDGNLWFTEGNDNQIGRITTGVGTTPVALAVDSAGNGVLEPEETVVVAPTWTNTGAAPIALAGTSSHFQGPAGPYVVTEFPGVTAFPTRIAAGPDGNLWFTESPSAIGRITPAGVITEFPVPSGNSPNDITAGPDGNLWFTEHDGQMIGRITTAGVITEFPIPSGNSPGGITGGPDGNLWFTEGSAHQIARITPAGVVTEFPVPSGNSPSDITVGPDGNLWFTESNLMIGQITTAGVVLMEFPVPSAHGLGSITAGPDGNLWFTDYENTNGISAVGRMTTAGVVTRFTLAGFAAPVGITAGPDDNLWFTKSNYFACECPQIGQITTAGLITEFDLPNADILGGGITSGPDCNVWFTEAGQIGRITTGATGSTYDNPDTTADYGSLDPGDSAECSDCYSVHVSAPTCAVRHWDTTLDETLSPTTTFQTWTLHVGGSFTDVLPTDMFYPSIETIFHNGVTAGCGDGSTFCPLQNNLRQEMAVFLLKASQGASYVPPACAPPGVFTDAACPGLYTDWIEDLKARNITAGCGDGTTYCPEADVLRQEMAVFLLKTLLGSDYVPPACTPPGVFTDVACPGLYTDWIEDLKTRGITAGCGDGTTFCPEATVTRQEMAAFLAITFDLVLYGP